MKITAIIDDDMIREAMKFSKTSTITATLKIALHEYIRLQKLKQMGKMVKAEPLEFNHSAEEIRTTNKTS